MCGDEILNKRKKVYEESGKKFYATDESEQLILQFNDDVLVGSKKVLIRGKGEINNHISAFLLKYLSGFHVPTHFIKNFSEKEMLVKNIELMPVEIRIHNIVNKNFSKRFGIEEGVELSSPIMEFYYKNDSPHKPMMNNSHIVVLQIASKEELKTIERLTSKINAVLKSFFSRRQIKLVNLKLAFGKLKNKIILRAAVSLDDCQLVLESSETDSGKKMLFFKPGDESEKYEQLRDIILK